MANVNNYIAAGQASVRKNLKARAALSENKTDFGALGQEAIKAERDKKIAVIQANAKVANAAQNAMTKVEGANIIVDRDKSVAASKRSARKAGMLAAGAQAIGAASYLNRKKDEPNAQLGILQQQMSSYDQRIADLKSKRTELESGLTDLPKPTDSSTEPTKQTATTPTSTGTDGYSLSGNRKILADAIAGPESGSWGYDAFNQGGAAGGTKVLGKSGAHKDHFGKPLTSMTVGEVIQRQSGYNDRSISDEQWRANGGLHAVGRYQFIGPTLKDEVTRMGLSMDTPFNQETQDNIFFSHAKRVGNISPWVGPSNQYDSNKRNELNSIIQGL